MHLYYASLEREFLKPGGTAGQYRRFDQRRFRGKKKLTSAGPTPTLRRPWLLSVQFSGGNYLDRENGNPTLL